MHEGDHTEGRDIGAAKFLRFSYAAFSIKTRMTPNDGTIDEGGTIFWNRSYLNRGEIRSSFGKEWCILQKSSRYSQ
jgi:hypothetical protein